MNLSRKTLHLIAAGDILIHDACIESAFNPEKNCYDFFPMFSYIQSIINKADIALCNLETTISGEEKGFSGYPRFNAPESLLKAIRDTGFTVVSTANNHSVDFGEHGILSTISALKRNGLLYSGTSESADPEIRNLIIESKSLKIGINAYTYGTNENPVPSDRKWLINMIDFDLISSDITNLRNRGADVIVICLHAGEEYLTTPDQTQIAYVKQLQKLGVDVILGNHPHIVQPAFFDSTKNKYIIYSIGNLLSNQRGSMRDTGVLIDITIEKTDNAFKVNNIEYHPTYVHRWEEAGKYQFRVIPLRNYKSIGSELPEFPFEKAENLLQQVETQLGKSI